ncbi:MAG: hypothetical protein HY744_05360 [Deltaproteobacteria bacterium]|nr:hypothetical protein [Deltaproteobacteria bacterium]
MTTAQQILSILRQVGLLEHLTTQSVGWALGVALAEKADANRYFRFYEAEGGAGAGPFASVELRVPAAGATTSEALLDLPLRPDAVVLLDELGADLGPAVPFDVNPRVMPEGTVTYRYDLGKLVLLVQFTARSQRLVAATVRGPS